MTYPNHIVRKVAAEHSAQRGETNLPALIEKYRFSRSPDVRALAIASEATLNAACELHWMARRYADGRQSYAVGMHNDHTRTLLALGAPLNPTGDGTLWAADGSGRIGPTPEDMGPEWAWYRETVAKVHDMLTTQRLRAERAEAALRAAGLEVPGA